MTVSYRVYRVVCNCFIYFTISPPSSVVTIGFNPATYSVTEGAGSVDVTVAVQGSLERAVVVTLSTMDGTATGGCTITC